jgi:hypothetical protein
VNTPGERFVAARTPEALADACTPDLHYEDPLLREPLAGPAALAAHRGRLEAAFPGIALTVLDELRDGERLVLAVRARGRQTALTDELPALERDLDVRAVVWCQLDRERVARARLFVDRWEAGEQLGLLPEPGSLAARALRTIQGFGFR